jgi:hypothetical protein
MIYFLALLPATALTIAGYFVLFLSARSEGGMRSFGKYLGFWAFTLAGLIILGAIFAAARDGHRCPIFGMHGMHERMQAPWPDEPRGLTPGANEPRNARPDADTPHRSEIPDAAPNAPGTPTAPPPTR